MLQKFIVGSYGCGDFRLHRCKIVEFIDHGNVQICRAWLAVSAVGALTFVRMEWCISDHRRVIFFFLRCCFICYGIIDLLFCIVAAHDGTDCRPCKCVMDALYRCQAYTERRTFFIKKSSTCKSLHNCDSHIIFLACFVQAGTVCIDSLQTAVKLFCKHGINVLTCRKHVKRRIDAEKDHLHIAGFCRFCGRKFSLEEGVLIPRPETEELVRTIVERHRSDSGLRILDIGTGSIAVTLAAELPDARVTAVDISDTALRIARRNAERHRQTVRFERRDILTGPPEGEFDLIVSNPPYVTESEKRQMSPNVLRYEPHRALFVPDDDPLLFYRAIAGLGRRLFAPGGTVYFEINERFGTQTVELLENEGYREIVLSKDFFGKPRTVSAQWK